MSALRTESTNGGSRRKFKFVGGQICLNERQNTIEMPPQNSKEAVLGNDFMVIQLVANIEEEIDK